MESLKLFFLFFGDAVFATRVPTRCLSPTTPQARKWMPRSAAEKQKK